MSVTFMLNRASEFVVVMMLAALPMALVDFIARSV
jgi:hypothetical protein